MNKAQILTLSFNDMEKNQIAKLALAAGACESGVRFFLSWEGTNQEYIIENPEDALWVYNNCPELRSIIEPFLEHCARKCPAAALFYVAENLSFSALQECAKREPIYALKYAAKCLPFSLLEEVAKLAPVQAIDFVASLLSERVLNECIKEAQKLAPWYTWNFVPEPISKDQIIESFEKAGAPESHITLFRYCENDLNKFAYEYPGLLLWVYAHCEELRPFIDGIKVQGERALEWCARQEPSDALHWVRKFLSECTIKMCENAIISPDESYD